MSRQHHYLKCETDFFQAVERGEKKFEIRIDDRNFQVFDMIYLQEVVNGTRTGRETTGFEIQYILRDVEQFGLKPGYCILNW